MLFVLPLRALLLPLASTDVILLAHLPVPSGVGNFPAHARPVTIVVADAITVNARHGADADTAEDDPVTTGHHRPALDLFL